MAAKKKANVKDIPVDQLDLFFRRHYKTILSTVLIAVALFILGYGIYNMLDSSRKVRAEGIASAEMTGLSTKEQIETYEKIANANAFVKDYINITAAGRWLAIGNDESAKAALERVNGQFSEYARSLSYDLGSMHTIDPNLISKGIFAPLWYYRAILAASEESRGALIAQFRAAWPDSALLAQLDKWGIK